ncbi:DUF1345 domain-containing protein [Cryptosporangium arvum]|uniref:Putative membrane protein n=1 Tax=Cryptosporangium arvum DSM 44712 TaxID=927661 RepID=A0A010Z363_9ACTN|nr:DUF1345 domain-containing protein [Cryptosporangium arvum]EXG81853.1 putative membrane protein [Cryptosporangium arvum DSM 44712]
MTSKATYLFSRAIEALLLVIGLVTIAAEDTILWISLWDCVAVFYLATRMYRLRRSNRRGDDVWLSRSLGGRIGLAFTVLTSIIGIGTGITIATSGDGEAKWLASAVGLPCVILAWAILHFGYAERYAKTFFGADPANPPLTFPNIDKPTYVEFAYFSFTIGTTFSVSDVETRTSPIRLQVLSHSVLSFIYNTATIGIAVSVITG